jgi:hypothetical protein
MIELTIGENGVEGIIYGQQGTIMSRTNYTSEENIPDAIRSKLSVLKLLHDSAEVPNIGQRVSDEIYWIFEDGGEAMPIHSKMILAEALLNKISIREAYMKFVKIKQRGRYE